MAEKSVGYFKIGNTHYWLVQNWNGIRGVHVLVNSQHVTRQDTEELARRWVFDHAKEELTHELADLEQTIKHYRQLLTGLTNIRSLNRFMQEDRRKHKRTA